MILALHTMEYLSLDFARQGLLAAIAVALACALLSFFVVLRRLAFIGQGISHAAFGGLGIAAVLGLAPLATDLTILGFCTIAALAMGALAGQRRAREDTAIGIILAAGMALGILLFAMRHSLGRFSWYQRFLGEAPPPQSWESVLFGSIQTVGINGVILAWVSAIFVALAVWWSWRPLLNYTFDEVSASAAGVPVRRMNALLMVLLAVVVVVGMKLVGLVLISALLVLPGATAAQLTRRLWPSLVLSGLSSLAGVIGGLVISFELDVLRLPSGPCIVLVLFLVFVASLILGRLRQPK